MSLIGRKFLSEICPEIVFKKILTLMTVRGIGTNTHDISECLRLQIHLLGKDGMGTALIEREFHVVDNLTTKGL